MPTTNTTNAAPAMQGAFQTCLCLIMETVDAEEAGRVAKFIRAQEGLIGFRHIQPNPVRSHHHVEGFFPDDPTISPEAFPDMVKRYLVPSRMLFPRLTLPPKTVFSDTRIRTV